MPKLAADAWWWSLFTILTVPTTSAGSTNVVWFFWGSARLWARFYSASDKEESGFYLDTQLPEGKWKMEDLPTCLYSQQAVWAALYLFASQAEVYLLVLHFQLKWNSVYSFFFFFFFKCTSDWTLSGTCVRVHLDLYVCWHFSNTLQTLTTHVNASCEERCFDSQVFTCFSWSMSGVLEYWDAFQNSRVDHDKIFFFFFYDNHVTGGMTCCCTSTKTCSVVAMQL